MNEPCHPLGKKLNYRFSNHTLLALALTHRSVNASNNERLEYLGDAILGFVIAESLYHKFPELSEGLLTRKRASLVKKETLAKLARGLELGQYVQLGSGERKTGGWRRESILANTLEAVIGAIYLDGGFENCRRIVIDLYQDLLENLDIGDSAKDAKTELQEYLQARKEPLPEYRVLAEEGEAHRRTFVVECRIESLDKPVTASGKSKRIAEQQAAQNLLDLIRK